MTRTETEQTLGLIAQTLQEIQALRAHQTELTALYGALTLNDVLEVGTGLIDATGAFSRDFRAPYAGLSIVNDASSVPVAAQAVDVAAGAAANVALPAGASLTGFDLTSYSTASGGVNFDATVTGAAALPNLTESFRFISSGAIWPMRFPDPLAPAAAAVPIAVAVPAAAGGAAYSLIVYGRQVAGALTATNSPRQGSAPPTGVGVFNINPGIGMTRRMAGNTLTVYGPVGQRFSYTVFSRPPAESFGRVG